MDKKLLNEMNVQINKEMFSGYLYLAMAAHFEAANLPGFAHWMTKQAEEELEHGMKFFGFLNQINERVELAAIEKPETTFGDPIKVFEKVLEHEKYISSRIHLLYKMADEINDYPTQMFLQWFVKEQVEEEANATAILEMLKIGGVQGNSLLMIDRHLAARSEG